MKLFIYFFALFGSFCTSSLLVTHIFTTQDTYLWYTFEANLIEDRMNGSQKKLNELIEKGEVTVDPTNGVDSISFFKNIKDDPNTKNIVLISNSQFIVQNDDRTLNHWTKLVHNRLQNMLNNSSHINYTVYNLSLGGITFEEIEILLETVLKRINVDWIIVGLNPSIGDGPIRDGLKRLKTINFQTKQNALSLGKLIEHINYNLSGFAKYFLRSVTNNSNRIAIQTWITSILSNDRSISRDHFKQNQKKAKPVQYPDAAIYFEKNKHKIDQLMNFVAEQTVNTNIKLIAILTPFRQDQEYPPYRNQEFLYEYSTYVEKLGKKNGIQVVNWIGILGHEHFNLYTHGIEAGNVDILHFDAKGHEILAGKMTNFFKE